MTDADHLLALVQSGTALMRECGIHRERINTAIRSLEQGQCLTRHENVDLLNGLAALCTRLQGDTHLRMFATERLAEQFAARLAEEAARLAEEKAPPVVARPPWFRRVLLALLS